MLCGIWLEKNIRIFHGEERSGEELWDTIRFNSFEAFGLRRTVEFSMGWRGLGGTLGYN